MNSSTGDLTSTKCAICATDIHDREVYPANFSPDDLNPIVFSARRLPDRLHYRMVVCRQCGLLRANPVLGPEALSLLYKESHGHDPQLSQAAADTYVSYFKENFSPFPFQGRILEIGCGPGLFLKTLLKAGCTQVYGVEPSRESVAQSGEIQGLIYNGMFSGGIYPSDYFDIICAFQMFDHLSDPVQFLKDCSQCLKPDGKMLLILHNVGAPIARLLGRNCPIVDIEHPILYQPATIIKLLEANGFRVEKKFSVFNRYPLRYWLQLMPLPLGIKKPMLNLLQGPLGSLTLTLWLGNMGIVVSKT